jgi:RNA polymerase sigma-70 factor (ECF subfamily)
MTDESQTDDNREALEGLRRGDQQALATLFSRHRDRLGRMVDFRLDARLRGRVSASDVLQEAYIDALKRLPHFQADPDVPFFIWLRTVTVQRLIEVHRQHLGAQARDAAREVRLGHGPMIEASSEKMAELIGDFTSPSQAAHRAEVMSGLREALDRLDPIDREVLALRHFEEMSNHEVAAMLGIQTAAASKRYVRALERLREALERSPGMEGGSG